MIKNYNYNKMKYKSNILKIQNINNILFKSKFKLNKFNDKIAYNIKLCKKKNLVNL